ncbi:MAG: hypothetical protein KIT79_12725 [Deltaproteobacteria bacterium]|nr:hypothetical protein [Deltaproteobacteria bacterium]
MSDRMISRARHGRDALLLERAALLNERPTAEALRRIHIAAVAMDYVRGYTDLDQLLEAVRSDPDEDNSGSGTPPEPEPEPSVYSPDEDALWHDEGVAG